MFRVYSQHGLILGKFTDFDSAIAALRNWLQAVFVTGPNGEVVARKE